MQILSNYKGEQNIYRGEFWQIALKQMTKVRLTRNTLAAHTSQMMFWEEQRTSKHPSQWHLTSFSSEDTGQTQTERCSRQARTLRKCQALEETRETGQLNLGWDPDTAHWWITWWNQRFCPRPVSLPLVVPSGASCFLVYWHINPVPASAFTRWSFCVPLCLFLSLIRTPLALGSTLI